METHSSSVNRSLDERCTGDQSIMLPTSSTSIVSRSTSALHAARMFGTHNRHNQSEDLAPPPNKKLPRIWRRSVPRAKIPHWFLKMFCGIEHSGEARARWFLKCFLNLAIVFVVICVVGLALWASILYLDTAENAASPPKDSLTRGVLGIGRALGLTRHYTNRRLAALARMEHMRDANRINVTTVASALAGGLKKLTDILALSREQRSSLISGSHRDFQLEYAQRLIATLLDEQKQVPNKAHVEVQRKDTELLPKLAKFLIRCANLKRGSPSANSEYLRACTSSLLPPSEEKDGRDKQHGGFEAVEPGQRTEEEESRFPFDEMALLQYRYAAGHQRRSGTDSHSGDMHLEQKSGKVHLGNYSKADLYQLPSVLNRRFYYPVRRWARANPFSPHSFAATDAWYSAVVSNVLYYCSGSVAKRVFTQKPSFLHIEPLSPTRNQDIKELFSSHHRTRLPSRTPDADTVTLFVSFASFRDEECSPTLLDLLQKAKNVHRVFVGVAEQNDPSDQFSCLPPELRDKVIPCYAQGSARTDGQEEQEARKRVLGVEATSEDPEFVLDFSRRVCFLGEHLRYRRVPAVTARGPTYGRFLSMLLYGGETMAMVLDSHNRFVPHWDSYIVHMHHKMHDPMAVLSHYPESYPYDKPGQIKKFDFLRSSTAYLCQAKFVKEFGFIRLGAIVIGDQQRFAVNNEYNRPYVMTSQQEPVSSEPNDKLPQPWIAGGFLFARASFLREVPFDPHLPYLFDGEEVLFSVRLWTHGYNMYSPERNVAYHFYGRPKAPKVWGMNPSWPAIQASSRERVNYLLHSLQVGLSTNSPAGPRRRRKRQPVSALPAKVRPRRVQLNFSNEDAFVIPRNTTLAHVVVDLERYGMGSVRTVEEWYKYAGIDRAQQKLDGRWCGP